MAEWKNRPASSSQHAILTPSSSSTREIEGICSECGGEGSHYHQARLADGRIVVECRTGRDEYGRPIRIPILVACDCEAGDPFRGLASDVIHAVKQYRRVVARPEWREFVGARLEDLAPGEHSDMLAVLEAGRSLYLFGEAGIGKTHAAWALLHHLAHQGRSIEAINVALWLERVKECIGTEEYNGEKTWPRRVDVLLVDDIAAQRFTDFNAECMYPVIAGRWESQVSPAKGRPPALTIVTSNYPAAAIEAQFGELKEDPKAGERAYSRLFGICEKRWLSGVDRRLSGRGQG